MYIMFHPDGLKSNNFFLPHSWLITRFVTRLIRRVPTVDQILPTLPEHLNSPPVFNGVRVTRSLVLCSCFVDRCLSFCPFSFGHCVVCSDYPFGIFKRYLNKTSLILFQKYMYCSCLCCHSIWLVWTFWVEGYLCRFFNCLFLSELPL